MEDEYPVFGIAMESRQLALRSGYKVNRQGGFYVRGRPYDTVKKLEVADDYQRQSYLLHSSGKISVNIF